MKKNQIIVQERPDLGGFCKKNTADFHAFVVFLGKKIGKLLF